MNIDPDKFLEHIAVPFIPTLGEVHPHALEASVTDLLAFAHDGSFLPYDKNKRWGGLKQERLLKEPLFQDSNQTIIPTYQDGVTPLLRLYCYGVPAAWEGVHSKLQRLYPQAKIQAITFETGKNFKSDSIVFLYKTGHPVPLAKTEVISLEALPPDTTRTIGLLAKNDTDNNGFLFLKERLAQGHDDGEILVTVDNGVISGAVGPLRTMTDAAGKLTRYPVYYGVSKEHRRKGLGRVLWAAAINWAQKNDVQYIVLQARTNSPAEHFYHQIGLIPLGGVSRKTLSEG